MQEIYYERILDETIKKRLKMIGAIVIEGPKWCGKTTTAEQIAKSILYMDDPDSREQNMTMASVNPKRLLVGDTPRLIDEWQEQTASCNCKTQTIDRTIWNWQR